MRLLLVCLCLFSLSCNPDRMAERQRWKRDLDRKRSYELMNYSRGYWSWWW